MNEEIKEQKNDIDNNIKITVTKEAGEILANLVVKANEGFAAGRINRQDLASFIIEKFKSTFVERDLIQLRQLHYDDAAMLEAMYRKMRVTGVIPEFLRDALRKQFQVPEESPKRSRKALTRDSINDGVEGLKESA